ncbi:suppression of tumorigenicity 5 protein-like isoform X2 [Ostrinia furnacalis]|uniref:suppression of tumorigenicity 5 protein-like isoform X1 n=1 Tax=Ostrinia furnacalis TaxID=93504 RepID=UPI00103EC577|nr:suppression of tumorigenicity 5 protein-like isoform X1 [Ostrinia furnacalis]XP_028164772.1 suppression of tumorigenicity 5 protein-like isoform X2 [Ostrinia furnacalis]
MANSFDEEVQYRVVHMRSPQLNRLMNEIYETVTAACNMDDRKPFSFPTESTDGSTSEDSIKLTRSLTEKRKNYVRRVSSRVAYLDQNNIKRPLRHRHQTSVCSYKSEIIDNPYSTFRSWKSFRTSRSNLNDSKMADTTESKFNLTDSTGNILSMKDEFDSDSIDKYSIDEKTGCVDIELPFEPRERGLFNICLLVGLNYMTGEAYVKSVFPNQVQVPPHIENLIFPETLSAASKGEWAAEAKGAQCYSLVLTDERGERSYGYCRRVLPEGASTCLPLCYCLIGRYRAPGFYYKVLQEIESHHGSSEVEIHSILQQLFETDFPSPGEELSITYNHKYDSDICISDKTYRNSVNLGDILKCKTMPDMRRSGGNEFSNEPSNGSKELDDGSNEVGDGSKELANGSDGSEARDYSDLPKFLDLENNNGPKKVLLSLENPRTRIIKRPLEPRVDEDNLSTLLDSLGAGLVIKVFGSLLLERKLVICSDQLSAVSSCMEALQSALYPFVWQQPLIAAIPSEIQRDVLEAPLPILAGMLKTQEVDYTGVLFEEGMLIDLTHPSKAIFYQGDESTILPTTSYKTLKTALQMETNKHTNKLDNKTRNVMISEAFLRFFVDILGDFWRFFSVGELKDGDLGKGNVVFDKEAYIKSVPSKQNQYFLEWFTETAMFNHFIQNMSVSIRLQPQSPTTPALPMSLKFEFADSKLVDTPLPLFYEIFNERLWRNKSAKSVDKSNYKSAVNKKVKLLKTKLRDLIT